MNCSFPFRIVLALLVAAPATGCIQRRSDQLTAGTDAVPLDNATSDLAALDLMVPADVDAANGADAAADTKDAAALDIDIQADAEVNGEIDVECIPNCEGTNWGQDGCGGCCGTTEICDGHDNDCDGVIDEKDAEGCVTFYLDADEDGFGYLGLTECWCEEAGEKPFTSLLPGDCNDSNPAINPGVKEVCNQIDDDCDDDIDNYGATGCEFKYYDGDNDGYGLSNYKKCVCGAKEEYSASQTGDCDEWDENVYPGADEYCNGVDDNCNFQIDEEGTLGCNIYYLDGDGDGWGVEGFSKCLCEPTGAFSAELNGDCNDSDPIVNPGMKEVCDGQDDDCDDDVDEEGSLGCNVYFLDFDNDGYGSSADKKCLCVPFGPYTAAKGGDCDDSNPFINVGTPETCNGYDDDCDGEVDDGLCCDSDCSELEECVQATTGGWVCAAKMVEVPAGSFWMGCNNCPGSTVNDTSCASNEHPYHEVYLDAYEIDKTEVTAAQFLACKTAGGCTAAGTGSYATYLVGGKEDHPINYVKKSQAEAYCLWVGKQLCTEAQWEKGARGGCEKNGGPSNCKAQSRKYPWGNDAPSCSLVVMGKCTEHTQPVCSVSPAGDSPYGLCDMAGNVYEWIADWYGSDYYCAGPGADTSSPWTYCAECGSWPGSPMAWSNPEGPWSGSYRVRRGGSFASHDDYLRVSYGSYGTPADDTGALGSRCCRSE